MAAVVVAACVGLWVSQEGVGGDGGRKEEEEEESEEEGRKNGR